MVGAGAFSKLRHYYMLHMFAHQATIIALLGFRLRARYIMTSSERSWQSSKSMILSSVGRDLAHL